MKRKAPTRARRPTRSLGVGVLVGAAATLLLVPGGTSAKALSPPKATNQPTVLGTPVEGKTLFTTNGSWSGTQPMSFRYRWLRCDTSGGGVNGVNCATIRRWHPRRRRLGRWHGRASHTRVQRQPTKRFDLARCLKRRRMLAQFPSARR